MAVERGEQPGVMGPESFPIRDPRSASMMNGRCANPVRFPEFGGLDKASKWFGHDNTSDQGGSRNIATLESGGPTGVKGGKRTYESQKG